MDHRQSSLHLYYSRREKRETCERRDMTAVFPLTWQSCRLGLHACPIGRASIATLRETLNPSSLSKQHFHSIHGSFKCSLVLPLQTCTARPKSALYALPPQPTGQARCVSLWKSKVEEPPRQKAARNEAQLSQAKINAIFRRKVGRKDGNDLLERLQEQRHGGTLDQKLPYPDALIARGLTYLRAKYPIDEDAAIIARIDREADREFRLPQTNIDKSPHAVSQFEKLIQEKKKRLEEERAEKPEGQTSVPKEISKEERRITVRDGTALVQLRPEPEWVRRYRDKAQMKELPEMSISARLIPSGLVTAAVVIVALLFAQNYKQPSLKARLFPDLPLAAATVIALIGVNVAVFILWRVPPFWKFLNRNFLVVPMYPYAMSMLMACFSHQSFTHLLSNMIPIWLIGTRRMSALCLFLNTLGLTMLNSTRRYWSWAISSSLLFQRSDCSIRTHGCLCYEKVPRYQYARS